MQADDTDLLQLLWLMIVMLVRGDDGIGRYMAQHHSVTAVDECSALSRVFCRCSIIFAIQLQAIYAFFLQFAHDNLKSYISRKLYSFRKNGVHCQS